MEKSANGDKTPPVGGQAALQGGGGKAVEDIILIFAASVWCLICVSQFYRVSKFPKPLMSPESRETSDSSHFTAIKITVTSTITLCATSATENHP